MSRQLRPGDIGRMLIPFGGLVVVYVVYRTAYDLIRLDDVRLSVAGEVWLTARPVAATLDDVVSRLFWGLSAAVFLLVSVGSLIGLVRLLSRSSAPRVLRVVMAALGIVAAGAMVAISLEGNPLTLPLFLDVLETTFERIGLEAGSLRLHLFTGLAGAVAILATFCSALCLVRDPSPTVDGVRARLAMLRRVLYLSAPVLVAGVVQTSTLHRLPAAFLAEPAAGAVARFALGLAAATGTLWTLFLLGLYLPAAWILEGDVARLVESAVPDASHARRNEWLAEAGLQSSPSQHLSRVAAMVSPLLAGGPMASLFEALAG
jgi:hypothetical protein